MLHNKRLQYAMAVSALLASILVSSAGAEVAVKAESAQPNHVQSSSSSTEHTPVVAVYIAGGKTELNAVSDLPAERLTHVLYAFLHLCGPEQRLQDAEICKGKADFDLAVDDNSIDRRFQQAFAEVKQDHPHLVVLPSLGGWGGSAPIAHMAATQEGRDHFIEQLSDYLRASPGFDGIDIDWEFPDNRDQGKDYTQLMFDLRDAFDKLEQELGRTLYITSAIPTHPSKVSLIDYAKAHVAMDYIFMMTYDFFGSWSKPHVGHQSALLGHSANLNPFGGATGTQTLLDAGVPAHKLLLGVAMYGRGWSGVTPESDSSPIGGVAQGLFPLARTNKDESGAAQYHEIVDRYLDDEGNAIDGFELRNDSACQCHYLWREKDGALLSFDHPLDVVKKGHYVREQGLGGIFAWEYSQDNGDLLDAMHSSVQPVAE